MKPDYKKLLLTYFPYLVIAWLFNKAGQCYRLAYGADAVVKVMAVIANLGAVIKQRPFPSLHPRDLLIGVVGAAVVRLMVYFKAQNAKKLNSPQAGACSLSRSGTRPPPTRRGKRKPTPRAIWRRSGRATRAQSPRRAISPTRPASERRSSAARRNAPTRPRRSIRKRSNRSRRHSIPPTRQRRSATGGGLRTRRKQRVSLSRSRDSRSGTERQVKQRARRRASKASPPLRSPRRSRSIRASMIRSGRAA